VPRPSPERPDPALGVFETVLVCAGRPHALDAHLERLERSAASLYGLALAPALAAELNDRAARLTGRHRLRVDGVPQAGGLAVTIQTSELPAGDPTGVSVRPVLVPGGLGAHKFADRRLLGALTTDDAVPLLIDRDGHVLEAAWGNLWLREGERLVTPPADGRLLPGLTRAHLFVAAPSLGLEALEEPITLERVAGAAEAFLTSALRLAVPARLSGPDPLAAGCEPPVASAELRRIRGALAPC
jgi:para-aminobenzoate synthetase / 4-amino-4-deoxychorismate lyase